MAREAIIQGGNAGVDSRLNPQHDPGHSEEGRNEYWNSVGKNIFGPGGPLVPLGQSYPSRGLLCPGFAVSGAAHDRLIHWFREWRAPLRRFLSLRRKVAPADIDDVAQEVFLRMLRYDRSELVLRPEAYLYKMAANVAAEWSMRSSRRQPHAAEWLEGLEAESTPETEFQRAAEELDLRQALAQLAPRAREILRLHFAEGLTHEAIGARLGLTRRVVKREMIRAYALLRSTLQAEDFS